MVMDTLLFGAEPPMTGTMDDVQWPPPPLPHRDAAVALADNDAHATVGV